VNADTTEALNLESSEPLTTMEQRSLSLIETLWNCIRDPKTRDLGKYKDLHHIEHTWTSDTVRFDITTQDFAITGERIRLDGDYAARDIMEVYFSAFPDLVFTDLSHIVKGNQVVTEWHAVGTHTGEFMGIEPTGHEDDLHGASIYTIKDNRVFATNVYWDVSALLYQMKWWGLAAPDTSPLSKEDVVKAVEEIISSLQGTLSTSNQDSQSTVGAVETISRLQSALASERLKDVSELFVSSGGLPGAPRSPRRTATHRSSSRGGSRTRPPSPH
jgi:predicted ester cyclase